VLTNFSLKQLLQVELFVACSETAGWCARPLLRWSIPGELRMPSAGQCRPQAWIDQLRSPAEIALDRSEAGAEPAARKAPVLDRVQSSVRRATRLERIAVDVSPGPPSPIAIRTARREIDPHAVRASRKQKAQARQNHIYCAALNLRNRSAHSAGYNSSRHDGSRSGPAG
jgi:hypothetical protein